MARTPKADTASFPARPGRTPRQADAAGFEPVVAETSPAAAGPKPGGDEDAMIAEMAFPVSGDAGADPEPAEPGGLPSAPSAAAPAARWDRASDAVSFDWPAIERAAAGNGPNQTMAKLLVAARAEGANTRWPF